MGQGQGRAGVDESRAWSWGLLLFGGGVSIAVNLGHAYLRPPDGGPLWSPSSWAIAWGVIVPLLLFFAVKGLTVIRWPRNWRWALWQLGAVAPVAALSGFVSWDHISSLLASIGERGLVCQLAPFAVDGLMLIGLGGLLIPRQPNTLTARSASMVRAVGEIAGRTNVAGPGPSAAARDELRRRFLAGEVAVPGPVAEQAASAVGPSGARVLADTQDAHERALKMPTTGVQCADDQDRSPPDCGHRSAAVKTVRPRYAAGAPS